MDCAILSARIFTGDPLRPFAAAIVFSGNRIIAVGSDEEVRPHIGSSTQVFELPGRLITPGLIDAHTHFVSLGLSYRRIDLNGTRSIEECRQKIRRAAETTAPGKWIIGRGWNHHHWRDGREPTRQDLDDITPNHPAMMIRTCGHSIWVNGPALAEAGIRRDTPEPEGGRIERYPNTGEPTGLIREARNLVEDHIPGPDSEEIRAAALAAQEAALGAGITGVHSCESLAEWEALSSLDREGMLKLRVYHLLPVDELEEAAARGIEPGSGSEHLWFGHAKLFADGSLGSGTALLHEPYADCDAGCGLAFLTPEGLCQKIDLAYGLGWDVAVHAIGDKALTNTLEAMADCRRKTPGPRRDRIEHVQLFRPRDLALFRELNVVGSVQPVFVATDWMPADRLWGADRCGNAYAWSSLLKAGIPLQFGSDAPVEPNNPLFGLHAAVTRKDRDGKPSGGWCPEQKLSLEQALEGYFKVAAWTSRREQALSMLAPGRWADLTVFEEDLFHLPPDRWLEAQVEMTVSGGEVVYHKPLLESPS